MGSYQTKPLTLSTLWANSADNKFTFSYISQKTGFDISCKLSPNKIIYKKCQILFSGKNNKNVSNCHLLKLLPSMLCYTTFNSGDTFCTAILIQFSHFTL